MAAPFDITYRQWFEINETILRNKLVKLPQHFEAHIFPVLDTCASVIIFQEFSNLAFLVLLGFAMLFLTNRRGHCSFLRANCYLLVYRSLEKFKILKIESHMELDRKIQEKC